MEQIIPTFIDKTLNCMTNVKNSMQFLLSQITINCRFAFIGTITIQYNYQNYNNRFNLSKVQFDYTDSAGLKMRHAGSSLTKYFGIRRDDLKVNVNYKNIQKYII